jgi:PAS domain-containing protein
MSLPARALALLLAALFLVATGYRVGVRSTDNDWKARQAETERAANTKFVRNTEIGIEAATDAITEQRAQETRYADLAKRHAALRKRMPLVVAAPLPAPQPGPIAAQGSVPLPAGPELSGGAVWLWNSALVGHPDVPPHSCGADGAIGDADPSCAQGAGLTVDDAWDNHTENAQSCARDRARYERLKAYLRKINR